MSARRYHPYKPVSPVPVPVPEHASGAASTSASGRVSPLPPAHANANGHARAGPHTHTHTHLPPSPPRSRRDASETPSVAAAQKWWDAELPAPPASLTAILDSFRKSGEGDRELLLAILGAKKAEEERLTAIIQTRLTVIQARLSYHAAAGDSASAASTAAPAGATEMLPPPLPDRASTSPPGYYHLHAGVAPVPAGRSPTLGPAPPHSHSHSPRKLPVIEEKNRLPPIQFDERRDRERRDDRPAGASTGAADKLERREERRSGGLEMLLDAGMQAERR
ncbi:hypothetical protein Q5752_006510 [Cryptotrichosporon argae]